MENKKSYSDQKKPSICIRKYTVLNMYRLLVIGKFLCQSLITLFKLDKLLKNNYAKIMDRIIRENPLRISIVNGVHLLQPQVKFVKHAHFRWKDSIRQLLRKLIPAYPFAITKSIDHHGVKLILACLKCIYSLTRFVKQRDLSLSVNIHKGTITYQIVGKA